MWYQNAGLENGGMEKREKKIIWHHAYRGQNLIVFLGHLQRVTQDTEAEVARVNRGMSICRSKKKSNLLNDTRIKACISRYGNST